MRLPVGRSRPRRPPLLLLSRLAAQARGSRCHCICPLPACRARRVAGGCIRTPSFPMHGFRLRSGLWEGLILGSRPMSRGNSSPGAPQIRGCCAHLILRFDSALLSPARLRTAKRLLSHFSVCRRVAISFPCTLTSRFHRHFLYCPTTLGTFLLPAKQGLPPSSLDSHSMLRQCIPAS